MGENKVEIIGLDTHCCGTVINTLENTGIDITPSGALPTERVMLLRHTDGSGLLPVHIINADILPSFLPGDTMDIQLCAIPLDICYYADEEAYNNILPDCNIPKLNLSKKLDIAEGSMLGLRFLSNHKVTDTSDASVNQEYDDDDYTFFKGIVKELYYGYFELGGEQTPSFIRCIVDTEYGEMQFVHTLDMVDEEMRKNMKAGAIVNGVCIVSGDVAVREYEKGIVKDFAHDLRLVRQVFMQGEAVRLRPVLKEDSVYESETSDKHITGADGIIEWIHYVKEHSDEIFAHLVSITETDAQDMEYPVGTQCLGIAYRSPETVESLCFIDVDESGMVSRIKILSDDRYRFKIEKMA